MRHQRGIDDRRAFSRDPCKLICVDLMEKLCGMKNMEGFQLLSMSYERSSRYRKKVVKKIKSVILGGEITSLPR